jgi:succinate dehydrogenase membrane anchor subunit
MVMVGNVTSLTNNGLRDWIIQRVSAIVIGAYAITILLVIGGKQAITYDIWVNVYQCMFMKVFTVLTLVSLVFHTWIGIWTVTTDYLKPVALRLGTQIIVAIFLLAMIIWALAILWSV